MLDERTQVHAPRAVTTRRPSDRCPSVPPAPATRTGSYRIMPPTMSTAIHRHTLGARSKDPAITRSRNAPTYTSRSRTNAFSRIAKPAYKVPELVGAALVIVWDVQGQLTTIGWRGPQVKSVDQARSYQVPVLLYRTQVSRTMRMPALPHCHRRVSPGITASEAAYPVRLQTACRLRRRGIRARWRTPGHRFRSGTLP